MNAATDASRPSPVWNLAWLTPLRCRVILALMLAVVSLENFRYIYFDCPVDLSADEAQYWDWSRDLDLSYYSKGPLVAYIIRASCAIFGTDEMWTVRLPAIFLAVATAICMYWLTRKLFRSERLALGVVAMTLIVPIFIAGAIAMTIDPPFIFCWALASCFLVKAIYGGSKWAWPAAGLAVGVGILAKYAAAVWLPVAILFCLIDKRSRLQLKTIGPWLAVVIAMACTTQIWVWNARHDWVSFKHVNKQIGASSDSRYKWWKEPFEFVGIQIGVVNPALAPFFVGGAVYGVSRVWGKRRRLAEETDRAADGVERAPSDVESEAERTRRGVLLLIVLSLPFFLFNFVITFWQKVQPNWPAVSYFGWVILAGYFIGTRVQSKRLWAPWRNCFWAAIVVGICVTAVMRDPSIVIGPLNQWTGGKISGKMDPTWRLRGHEELAREVEKHLKDLPAGAMVLCEDYQTGSLMAFYMNGHPKTYVAGSYWKNPAERRRMTQYDVWPDRQLDRPELKGRDAIYIGDPKDARFAFETFEQLPDLVIEKNGLKLRTFMLWRGEGFKGMSRPTDGKTGN